MAGEDTAPALVRVNTSDGGIDGVSLGDTGTLSLLPATCLALNQCMGVGWLTTPWAVAQSGMVLGSLLLIFFMFAANTTKNFLVESMARSEALTQWREEASEAAKDAEALSTLEGASVRSEDESLKADLTLSKNHMTSSDPKYEITSRKFEMTDVSRVTLGLWPTIVFGLMYIFSTFISLCVYGQVFALALGTNIGPALARSIPSMGDKCGLQDSMAFGDSCWPAYGISVAIFAVIVWTLAVLGFKETYHVQCAFSFVRVAVLLMMVITLLADPHLESFGEIPDAEITDGETLDSMSFYFNFAGIGRAIPILCYTFINLDTVPSVAQSMRPGLRKHVRGVYAVNYVVLLAAYLLCSFTAAFILTTNGKEVSDSINLVWNNYGGVNASGGQLAIRYLVVFLPALDVLSSFPIQVTALTGNIVALFVGQKYTIPAHGFSVRRVATFSAVVFIPVILALFFTEIGSSLDISGPMSIAFAYLYPVLFAWLGRNKTIAAFGAVKGALTPFSNRYSRVWFYIVATTFFSLLVIFLLLALAGEYGVEAFAFAN